jgi:hypothetical protein
MGRVPIAAGWVRDEKEGILMKCVWQRAVRRDQDGKEDLRTIWLCESSEGFAVRAEDVYASGRHYVIWETDPIPEGLLRGDIRLVARFARRIEEAARALLGWISRGGVLEGVEGLNLSVDLGEGVWVKIRCEKNRGTYQASLTIQPYELTFPLEDWGAVEALAQALE